MDIDKILIIIDRVTKDPSKKGQYLSRHILNEIERHGLVIMPAYLINQMTEQMVSSKVKMEEAAHVIDVLITENNQLKMERAARYN